MLKIFEENRREAEQTEQAVKSFMQNPTAQKLFNGEWRPDPTSLQDRAKLRSLFRPIKDNSALRKELGQIIVSSDDSALRTSFHFLRNEVSSLAEDEPLFKKDEIVRAPTEEIPDENFDVDFPGHKDAADGWQVVGTDVDGNVTLQKVVEFGNTGQVSPIGESITVSELAVASSNDTKNLPN